VLVVVPLNVEVAEEHSNVSAKEVAVSSMTAEVAVAADEVDDDSDGRITTNRSGTVRLLSSPRIPGVCSMRLTLIVS